MESNKEQKKVLNTIEVENCISVLEHLLENGDQLIHLPEEQRIKLM